MPEEFNAKRSRAKRPLPLWVDAILADVQFMEADEFGAYMKILMSMWRSESLSISSEPKRLARVAGVSLRLWNSRIADVILPKLCDHEGGFSQARIQKEAAYVERQVTLQSNRKRGKNSDKPLETNNQASTTDSTTDTSTEYPSYNLQPTLNNSSKEEYVAIDETSEAVSIYNGFTKLCGWPEVQKLTKPRRTAILGRLKDCGGLDGWKIALEKASQSHFLTGQTSKPFFASFDWLTKPANFVKLMEGNYVNRTNGGQNNGNGNISDQRGEATLDLIAQAARAR